MTLVLNSDVSYKHMLKNYIKDELINAMKEFEKGFRRTFISHKDWEMFMDELTLNTFVSKTEWKEFINEISAKLLKDRRYVVKNVIEIKKHISSIDDKFNSLIIRVLDIESQIKEINTKIEIEKKKINKSVVNSNKISKILTELDESREYISKVEDSISSNTNDITTLSSQLDESREYISKVEKDIRENKIAQMNCEIRRLDVKYNTIEKHLGSTLNYIQGINKINTISPFLPFLQYHA